MSVKHHAMKTYGEEEVQLHSFFTSPLDVAIIQIHFGKQMTTETKLSIRNIEGKTEIWKVTFGFLNKRGNICNQRVKFSR